ncbi:leucine-rich repeat domain-containing protein [Listeria monocytogenes]|nr:internalin [Listeria monocytogenes]EGB9983320.1 internalin [Listeria monocytogenes]EIA3997766.1 leucine-rich repeat domain-containing protein [Listeria monocytogenes]EJW2904710.1 leucine-rich repeat domain-containing protein [Listeria monocytogenes]EKZ6912960.1 leucine-rich repeat domain-containing protein [Listeria monocytogenes]
MKDKKFLQRLFIALTIILGINVWIGSSGETEVKAANITQPTPINQVFPDANLAEVMRGILQKPNVSTPVTQDELNVVGGIEVFDELSIASIEGVQYLTNLRNLYMDNNQISNLTPISGLANLETLHLNNNQISDLGSLSGLINIRNLIMDNNQVSDLTPLSGLISLQTLQLNNNQISDLSSLSNATNLWALSINNNQISDLTPISRLTNLEVLHLNNNQVSNLTPISDFTNLAILYLDNNQVSDLTPISGFTNLSILHLNNNQISNIGVLSDFTSLSEILLDNNQISDLSALKDISMPMMGVSMKNQQVNNKPVDYQTNMFLPNTVRDNTNTLVTPETISDNGSYSSSNITWDLPEYKNQVSYTFNQQVNIGYQMATFSGTVNQPLTKAPLDYKMIFDIDGTKTSEKVAQDSFITAPSSPTKEGYTFIGWYDAPTGGNEWDFATDKMPAKDITLFAQFSKNSSDEGTPGDKGRDEGDGGKCGTADKPTESESQPIDSNKKSSRLLNSKYNTLSARATHLIGSEVKTDSHSTSLPPTGDETSVNIFLQSIGILFLLAFFWIGLSKKKKASHKR